MTSLLRATLPPRPVRPAVLATAGAALLFAGVVIGIAAPRARIVVTPPAVVVLPAQVNVAPAPVVLPPPPPVAEVPAVPPATEPPPQPRALVPMLDAGCVLSTDGAVLLTCAWDDGFPAISADGTLIATKYMPDTGPSENYGLSIRFLDTKTSRVVRDVAILKLEEQAEMFSPDGAASEHAPPDDQQLQRRQRLMATIARRVAAVQRTFEAKHFRSLRALGSARNISDEAASQRGPDPIYAEIVGTTARIVDSTASQVLWRHDFEVTGPRRTRSEEAECSGWSPWSIALWWDPETRHVLAEQQYRTGGCMCRDIPVETVARIP